MPTKSESNASFRKPRFVFLVLALALIFSVVFVGGVCGADVWDGTSVDTIWSGSGTESNPYLITSAAELAGLAQKVNNGTSYSGKYFKLTTDIDLNNYEWTPIGTAEKYRSDWTLFNPKYDYRNKKPFAGTFLGDGHTISNLKATANTGEVVGLFGCVSGTISDLHLQNSLITISGTALTVGSMVGFLDGGEVKSSSVSKSTVKIVDDNLLSSIVSFIWGYTAGGVVGENSGGSVSASVNALGVNVPSGNTLFDGYSGSIVGKGGLGSSSSTEEEIKEYKLVSTTGEHGTISPLGETVATEGFSQEYKIIPDSGYVIQQILLDDVDVTTDESISTNTFTVDDIKADHTIHVEFEEGISYTITIPDELIIYEDKAGEMDITPTHLWIPDTSSLSVRVKSDNSFHLIYGYDSSIDLEYALKNGNTVIPNNGVAATFTMANKDAVSLSAELTGNEIRYAGEYADKLTFTVEVVKGTA